MEKKILGIIGGVGPLATMYIGEMIVRRTKAKTDQEHIHMLIANDTTIPDRTAYILDHSKPNPVPVMLSTADKLTSIGAEVIALPCNTAHTFYDELQAGTSVPILHMIRETAKRAHELGARRVGILATTGTLFSGVYQQALLEQGIEPVLPSEEIQQQVMSVIYDYVKAGKDVTQNEWASIEAAMRQAGCDRIILGCTELSIVQNKLQLTEPYIDSLLVLAESAILASGYELAD